MPDGIASRELNSQLPPVPIAAPNRRPIKLGKCDGQRAISPSLERSADHRQSDTLVALHMASRQDPYLLVVARSRLVRILAPEPHSSYIALAAMSHKRPSSPALPATATQLTPAQP